MKTNFGVLFEWPLKTGFTVSFFIRLPLQILNVVCILLINVKIPPIVGNLTFMSRIIIPEFFFKKQRGYCIRLRPSVCPSVRLSVRPSVLNHWTKFNQIWCVSFSHEWSVQRQTFYWPRPLGLWGGVKRSNIIEFQLRSHFQRFYTKLCVCSHKWKIQNISDGIFIPSPGSCPRGGALGVPRGSFFQTWSCGISNRREWRAEQNASKIFILGSNWWPWGEVKRSNIIKFWLPCEF